MKDKGFTLIELLAVVMVLGIIALIAVPSVSSILSKGKKDALLVTANNLMDTTKQYYMNELLVNDALDSSVSLNVTDSTNMGLLNYSGKLPSSGYILLDASGNVGIAVSQGGYCAKKEVYSSKVTVTKDDSECSITSLEELEEINNSCFVLDDSRDTIIGYKYDNPSCSSDVVIPAEIGGNAITTIADGAFWVGIEKIGYYGQYENTLDYDYIKKNNLELQVYGAYPKYSETEPFSISLTSVDFSYATNLVYIGDISFMSTGLTSVKFGANNSKISYIGPSAFSNNYISGEVDLSGLIALSQINGSTFSENQIENVKLPNGLKTIGLAAFNEDMISNIIFPESLESIKDYSFGHNQLLNLVIPNNVKEIRYGAFGDNNVSTLTLGNSLEYLSGFYDNSITSIDIPSTVTTIGNFAFGINALTSVIIPDSVTQVGDNAFNSNNISSLTLSKNLQSIGYYAFGHNSITSVDLPEGLVTIETSAFASNQINAITLPSTLIYLAGFDYNNLSTLIIPNGVTTIDSFAFENNNLTSIEIPDSVTSLSFWSFAYNNLAEIDLSSNLISIGNNAFYGNKLTNVTIPSKVTTIQSSAFSKNTSSNPDLTTITNLTGLSFNWYTITNNYSGNYCIFVTGTCSNTGVVIN